MLKSLSLESLAASVTLWSERWFPNSYIFAALGVLIASLGALYAGAPLHSISLAFGDGYWSLIPFTLQMVMVSVSGYVLAVSPPASRWITRLARVPKTGRGAVTFVAGVTILTSLFNWALSLIVGGLLVKALARRNNLRMDYRAAGAAAYLGLGATWALGISSSAAQLQANPQSLPKSLLDITGVIPFQETIFLPQSIFLLSVITMISLAVAYFSAPSDLRAKTSADLGIHLEKDQSSLSIPESSLRRPGDWLEDSPLFTLILSALGLLWLIHEFRTKGIFQGISNLNTYNFLFLTLGALLHWRPRSFLKAVGEAVPTTTGVLIQFPLYGSIAFILTAAQNSNGHTLAHVISDFFVRISSASSFPGFMGIYSAVLGFFIPSGGGKWIIEAPYLMQAANNLHVHLGWTVQVYNAAEAVPNLINPFWMLPLLGILGLKAQDIVGYTFTQFIVHLPVVLILLWLLGSTLTYHPPYFPT